MQVLLIYDANTETLETAQPQGDDLWVAAPELQVATGWHLEEEGVCRDTICVPVPEDRLSHLTRGASEDERMNLSEVARLIEQPFARTTSGDAWSFGPPSWEWKSRLSNALAPDFTLPDFDGRLHSLSDLRGKKVFLLLWASWCSCRLDLPVWSALREELKDQNFEVVTVACETKGRDAALPFLEAASPAHPRLLDEHHLVAELYNARNVPAAFWIDEQGRIVRANDPIYAKKRTFENGAITREETNERYLDAVREWVAKGPEAHYARVDNDLKEGLGEETWEDVQARAHFRLGMQLYEQGRTQEAVEQFKQAHALAPGNWTYKRQAWNLGSIEQDYGFKNILEAIAAPGTPPFYRKVGIAETPI
jgi:peroxiredoxin